MDLAELTDRERQVLDLIRDGVTADKAIAARLGLSPKTVEIYKARIRDKYGAATTTALLIKLLQEAV